MSQWSNAKKFAMQPIARIANKLQLRIEVVMGIIQPIEESHREFVGSLAKGLNVIRVFGKDSPEMSVTEVAKATETTRAAARRLLLTLHSLGYVQTRRPALPAGAEDAGARLLLSELAQLAVDRLADARPPEGQPRRKRFGDHSRGHRCRLPRPLSGRPRHDAVDGRRLAAAGLLHGDGPRADRRTAGRRGAPDPRSARCSTNTRRAPSSTATR